MTSTTHCSDLLVGSLPKFRSSRVPQPAEIPIFNVSPVVLGFRPSVVSSASFSVSPRPLPLFASCLPISLLPSLFVSFLYVSFVSFVSRDLSVSHVSASLVSSSLPFVSLSPPSLATSPCLRLLLLSPPSVTATGRPSVAVPAIVRRTAHQHRAVRPAHQRRAVRPAITVGVTPPVTATTVTVAITSSINGGAFITSTAVTAASRHSASLCLIG